MSKKCGKLFGARVLLDEMSLRILRFVDAQIGEVPWVHDIVAQSRRTAALATSRAVRASGQHDRYSRYH